MLTVRVVKRHQPRISDSLNTTRALLLRFDSSNHPDFPDGMVDGRSKMYLNGNRRWQRKKIEAKIKKPRHPPLLGSLAQDLLTLNTFIKGIKVPLFGPALVPPKVKYFTLGDQH